MMTKYDRLALSQAEEKRKRRARRDYDHALRAAMNRARQKAEQAEMEVADWLSSPAASAWSSR